MKKQLTIIAIIFTCLFSACKKDGDDPGSASAITDEAIAKAAFLKINDLWKGTLRPLIAKTEKTYTNETISGLDGGQAVINGRYYTTRISSSSSSTSSSYMDLVITFNNYAANGLKLDGKVEFFDTSDSRSACSSSGCAFSNHSSISYSTNDGSGNNYPPVTIQVDNNGGKINDKILIRASKSDNFHWGIKMTNSAGQVFSFSY